MAITQLNNRSINRSDTAAAGEKWTATSATASDFQAAGGITVADSWRLTTTFTGQADPISSNLEQVDQTVEGTIGSAMTQSSGIFTFPSTGVYLVSFGSTFFYSGDSRIGHVKIHGTTDNSTYAELAQGSQAITQSQSGETFSNAFVQNLVDVTNTTNVKVKFEIQQGNGNASCFGDSAKNLTFMMFIRLGDT